MLTACGGNVRHVRITETTSAVYSDADVRSAIDVAARYFQRESDGCTLTEITYIGDDQNDGWQEFAERHHADDVTVLVSSFDVDNSGGDGSLNPNSTYRNWKWILVRSNGGP